MQTVKIILAIAIITVLIGGCSTSRSTKVYTESQALEVQNVKSGIIESVEPATLRKDGTIIGTASGAILGGIGASTVGKGTGNQLATAAGVMLGGLIGHYLEQGVTDRDALKLVIKMDNGQRIAIVQEADVAFQPGERVNILTSHTDNTKRVSKIGDTTIPDNQ